MRTGLYPGSFDPITNGHIDIIKRSLAIVDRLIVAIGISATKTPVFTFEQRQAMIEAEIGPIAKQKGVELSVIAFDDLLVDVARKNGVDIILRGLRTAADYEYARADDLDEPRHGAGNRDGFPAGIAGSQLCLIDLGAADSGHGRRCQPAAIGLAKYKQNQYIERRVSCVT